MKKIFLPDYLEDFAGAYARDYVEEIQGLNPNDTGYNNATKNALQSFCSDYYESLTGIESNPSSAKAKESFETLFPVLFDSARLKLKIKNKEHAKLIQQRVKSSIMHLVHIYMIVVADISPKDTQYEKGKKSTEEEKMKVAKARLSRSILVMIFFSHLLGAFRINPDSLNTLVTTIIKNNGLSKVNNKGFREDLAKETWVVLKEEVQKIKIIQPLWKVFQNKIFKYSIKKGSKTVLI